MNFIFLCLSSIIMNVENLPAVSGNSTPPSKPNHVTLLADTHKIGVQWEPPTDTNGNIRNYIVSWSILPNFTDVSPPNIVDGAETMSIILVHGNVGRLFRIRVRAENNAGVGAYSDPQYIRIGCGEILELLPFTDKVVTSPGFNTHPLAAGVICKWTVKTQEKFILSFTFQTLSLVNHTHTASEQIIPCAQTYINITDHSAVKQFCDNSREKLPVFSETNMADITLLTGSLAGGRGFSLTVRSVPKMPGPPTDIRIWTNEHAIKLSWQPPSESTLAITSYNIRYKVMSTGREMAVAVGASMRAFPINSQAFQGKVVRISITAVIGGEEGQRSRSLYARAACRRHIKLDPGERVNITSPNYPHPYPSSIVCTWNIHASPRTTFHVTYIDFRLEDTPFCSSDYVTFSSFSNHQRVCARMELPKTFAIETSNFTMTFVTDNKLQFRGFLLELKSTGIPTEASTTVSSASFTRITASHISTSGHIQNIPTSEHVQNIPTSGHVQNIPTSGHIQNIPTSEHIINTPSSRYAMTTRSPYSTIFTSSTLKRDLNFVDLYHNTETKATSHQWPEVTLTTSNPIHINPLSSTTPNLIHINPRPSARAKINNGVRKPVKTELPNTESTGLAQNLNTPRPQKVSTIRDRTGLVGTESTITESIGLVRLLNRTRHRTAIASSSPKHTSRNDQQTNDTQPSASSDSPDLLIPVVVGVAVVMVVASVGVVAFCRRRWRRRMKVNTECSERHRQTTIEMYDIVPQVRTHHQTKVFTAHTPLPAIEEEREEVDAVAVASQYTGDKGGRRKKTWKKHNTFPSRFSDKRKVHREVEKAMKAFSFIEDTNALEQHIRRKYVRRRTNSL